MKWSGEVVAQIDMLLTLVIVFMALCVLVMPSTPPKAAQDRAICVMAVDLTWPDSNNSDMDLWVKPPDGKAIGYANSDTPDGALVKDDMGIINDRAGVNNERICIRSLVDGEYIVNLVLYDIHSGSSPVPCHVSVSLVDPASAEMEEIFKGDVSVSDPRTENTVIRITIKGGRIAPEFTSTVPADIITYGN